MGVVKLLSHSFIPILTASALMVNSLEETRMSIVRTRTIETSKDKVSTTLKIETYLALPYP